MPFLAPPDECLIELMGAKDEREGGQRHVVPTSVHVTDDIDTDPTDDEAAHEVSLRGEAHVQIYVVAPTQPSTPRALRQLVTAPFGPRRRRGRVREQTEAWPS